MGAGQHRRAVEEPLVSAVGDQASASVDAGGHEQVHVVALACFDDRLEGHVAAGGVADRLSVGVLGQQLGLVGDDPCVHQVAAGRHAYLPLVHKGAEGAHRHRPLHVDVAHHDQDRVAP